MRIKLPIFIIIVGLILGCQRSYTTLSSPDFSSGRYWYNQHNTPGDNDLDIFFIPSSIISDWSDSSGKFHHNIDIENITHRDSLESSMLLGANLAGAKYNFYSPFYRQITLESWYLYPFGEWEKRFYVAMTDIKESFRYYMNKINSGRPFILIGCGQGAKGVIEILKQEISRDLYKRLVAAYAIGFPVTQDEMEKNRYIIPAQKEDDYGVTIVFNSVSDITGISPLLKDSWMCINPLSWSVGEEEADSVLHKGALFINKSKEINRELKEKISAKIDKEHNILIVKGVDPQKYYIPKSGLIFPKGSFHNCELNLFFENIRQNIDQRYLSWRKHSI